MQIGLALPVFDLEAWTARRLEEITEDAQWAEAAGFDSVWISDHLFMTRGDDRTAGLEPITTLSYLAARTSTITLGSLVLCNNFRNVGQLAREVAVLVQASNGRLVVGLGCGAQPNEHVAFDLPFENRVSRLEESLTVLPKLLRGETVTYEGRFVRLVDASITTSGQVPPLWVAAFRPRMMDIASRLAQGWAGNWNGPDPTDFQEQVATVRGALEQAGRAEQPFDIVANLLVVPHRGATAEVADRAQGLLPDQTPVQSRVIFGAAEDLVHALGAYRDAGATHAILAASPRQFSTFDGSSRDELAVAVREFAHGTVSTGGRS